MAYLSVCIPTYEMNGQGVRFLKESFDKLANQTLRDFDVVISDHSQDSLIKDLCATYADTLEIHYYQNTENRGSSSANINTAIKYATGRLIKVLFQDDFLYDKNSLQTTVDAFDIQKDHWLISSYIHTQDGVVFYNTHTPRYTHDIHLGHNRIGTPSALTIKNENVPFFDEQLIWLMDGEYYKRLYGAYGAPKILQRITVVNRVGIHQVTATLATLTKQKQEFNYVLAKYEHGYMKTWYRLYYSLKFFIKSIFRHD